MALGEDGAIPSMKSGAVFIDNSTVSADVAGQLYDAGKALGFEHSMRRSRVGRQVPKMVN